MKRKLAIGTLILMLLLVAGYRYVYQQHRDIATEKESFVVSVDSIFSEYQKNEAEADKKYLNKTIVVTGKASLVNLQTQSIVLDEKLFAVLSNKISNDIKLKSAVKVKGRLIGYDSLLEQIKMDQCVIQN